jgi:hypothetical protein
MKNRIITGAGGILSGLLIALGPQYIFRLCGPGADGSWMRCQFTGQAEICVGFLICALGAALLVFSSRQAGLALSLAIMLTALLSLLFPSALIGGCMMETMACRRTVFPALTVIGAITIAGFALNALYLLGGIRKRREI